MEYPIWQLTTLGGGFWIALIATVHVYVAHFAVGGGLFLVLMEQAAYRTHNEHLLQYTKKHTHFFLLLTMVFGAVTGVAIWFTVALLAPQATITLIHQFVFGWAAEWVCFLGEIVALVIYYYTWETMKRREHLIVGALYFVFGWFSLFLINGIIGFMLTPGDWIETQSFWDGFFNPSFWPALIFRTFFSAACAGLFGFVTATRIKDTTTRDSVLRTCAGWTILGVLATVATGYWYIAALPTEQQAMIMMQSHRVGDFMGLFWIFGILTLLGGLLLAFRLPRLITFPIALLVLLAGQGLFGSFEFIRESGRKPYLIWDYVYSNSIMKANIPLINEQGILHRAKWTPPELKHGINDQNRMKAGEFLFHLECASCHSIGGPMNEIREKTQQYNTSGMDAFLTGMGKLNPYMPPFAGTTQERYALAVYIAQGLNKKGIDEEPVIPEAQEAKVPEFSMEDDAYALFAWADQGLRFSVESPQFVLLPAKNVIRAQLILRDDVMPEIIMPDEENPLQITYKVEEGMTGDKLSGKLQALPDHGRYEANLRIEPRQNGDFQPLPILTIEAHDSDGKLLAKTKMTAPTSDQMGCRNCHGGPWKDKTSGLADITAENILATHDRINKTNHVANAKKGRILCVTCHDDPAQGAIGSDAYPTLSAAIHGTHALFLAGRDSEHSCLMCHPKNTLRGQHYDMGFECSNCHGTMEDHAIALLRADQEKGKKTANRLLKLLKPNAVETEEEVKPRIAWTNEPDCLNCHKDFASPESDTTFNEWTKDMDGLYAGRRDEMEAIYCAACHGHPHAIYPATQRDSLQPLQYMGEAQSMGAGAHCAVCHKEDREDPMHHADMGLNEE